MRFKWRLAGGIFLLAYLMVFHIIRLLVWAIRYIIAGLLFVLFVVPYRLVKGQQVRIERNKLAKAKVRMQNYQNDKE